MTDAGTYDTHGSYDGDSALVCAGMSATGNNLFCCRRPENRSQGVQPPITAPPLGDEINRDPLGDSFRWVGYTGFDDFVFEQFEDENLHAFVGNEPISSVDSNGYLAACLCRVVDDIPTKCHRIPLTNLGWHWGHTCVLNCACKSKRLGNYLQSYRVTRPNFEPCVFFNGYNLVFAE